MFFGFRYSQEFEIPSDVQMKGLGSLPGGVVEAALGGTHKPVNPHRQRLLVAANKAVDLHTTNNKAEAKPKPKPPLTTKDAAAPEAETTKTNDDPAGGNVNIKPKKRAPYADTAYNIARKSFMATLLDLTGIAT